MTAAVCTCETYGFCAACRRPAECPHPMEYLHADTGGRLRCIRCGATVAQEAAR